MSTRTAILRALSTRNNPDGLAAYDYTLADGTDVVCLAGTGDETRDGCWVYAADDLASWLAERGGASEHGAYQDLCDSSVTVYGESLSDADAIALHESVGLWPCEPGLCLRHPVADRLEAAAGAAE